MRYRTLLLACMLPLVLSSPDACAAEEPGAPDGEQSLVRALRDISGLTTNIDALKQRIPEVDGIDRRIYERRLEREWAAVIDLTHALARDIALLERDGVDPARYRAAVDEILPRIDEALSDGTQRLQGQLGALTVPQAETTPRALASFYYRRHELLERLIELLRARVENSALMSAFEAHQSAAEAAYKSLASQVGETAERVSLALEIARDDLAATNYQITELPGDEPLKAERAVLLARINQLADLLHAIIPLMETLQLDPTRYRQQIVLSTGQISEDLLDGDMMAGLAAQTLKAITDWVSENAAGLIVKTLVLVVIVTVFWFLSRLVSQLVRRAMSSSRVSASQLLKDLSARFAGQLVLLLGLLIALSQIGVAVGPVLAGLGVAGFIIGFALQDTLSNFASGIMILFYRPFDVGDVVEAGDVFGKVKGMSLVNCTFHTFDNQELVVPNSKIWGGVIRNVTAQTTRRVDMSFGISYADDVDHAERVLSDILQSHPKVLDEPEAVVKLHELGDSSVNFVVRPWVQRDDYWDVYWDVTRLVKKRFDEEGISIPFPQRDVHLFAVGNPGTAEA